MSKSRDLGEFPAAALDIDASGAITTTGPIDGRDVSTDGTKLDTIETSADVTDTANVTSSGALMDSELASIASVKALNQGVATTDDPTFTNTHLAAIDATIAATAVDTFVYDTRKDSDGGAWRKRTQHTSWYNETLNTSTRGSRKEFPVVAVIVAESGTLTIYDGDDPSMPMWMVFNQAGWNVTLIIGADNTSTSMINGKLAVGTAPNAQGLVLIDFILDRSQAHLTASNYGGVDRTSLALRNAPGHTFSAGTALGDPTGNIASNAVNDVAMTVLPNAPIDPATGLPVPTIAVATNGGVSVIKDDGTVVDIVFLSHGVVGSIEFIDNDKILFGNDTWDTGRFIKVYKIPSSDMSENYGYFKNNALEAYQVRPDGTADITLATGTANLLGVANRSFATSKGLALIDPNIVNPTNGSSAVITSDYNTGYMNGDIKLATLSDTDTTNAVGTELVANGTFDSDTGWSKGTGWSISGGQAINDGTQTGYSHLEQDVLESGKGYTITVTVVAVSGDVLIGSSGDYFSITSAGTYSYSFYANVDTDASITCGVGDTVTLDNVSVKENEPDRSVNGNGLQVFGTVTKTPVATGADLVGYSGFSASNYLQQPYNADLDFGTGDFSCAVWLKSSVAGNSCVFHRGSGSAGSWGSAIIQLEKNTTNLSLVVSDDGFSTATYVSVAESLITTGIWKLVHVVCSSGTFYMYIDGVQVGSTTASLNLTNTTAKLWVGERPNMSRPWDGSLALFRISATAPSAEQIAKIYEDEKPLFQENAKATLYGISNVVTALAYDDDTELLHAGTSSGRSVFQGLRRVSNTTDAVTTSISASNSIIVEE